jgi:hypothetical protein
VIDHKTFKKIKSAHRKSTYKVCLICRFRVSRLYFFLNLIVDHTKSTYKQENFLTVEIPTPKPFIFMIGVTRRIKCIVVHNPGVNPHPLPAQNFLTVEIPTPKPYIFIIGVTRRIKCIVVHNPGVNPHPYLPRTF